MPQNLGSNYYKETIDLQNIAGLESRFIALLDTPLRSSSDLENWLEDEQRLIDQIQEIMTGHEVDFYRDTENEEKQAKYRHDQQTVQPLLLNFQAKLDRKICESPYINELDEARYGLMRQVRQTKVELFREENIPLQVREQELGAKYSEIMGGLTIEWDGEEKPYPFVQSLLDSPDRSIREKAFRAIASAHREIKPEMDVLMDELIKLRHEIALNAGFDNYRDYMFTYKNREFTVEECYRFHENVESHIIPAWNRLAEVFKKELGVDTYRPWDATAKLLKNPPYTDIEDLMDGVAGMLEKTDPYFAERFQFMRDNDLLDLGGRKGKSPGGFCTGLPVSKNSFVFANFSPSFFALIALIHEMGHAVNSYLQYEKGETLAEYKWRAEVAELYSHGMELLLLDKLDTFYPDPDEFKRAQREELRRAFTMLFGPLSGDLFQHWMYTHPNHTAKERDAKYLELLKRYGLSPVDISGFEEYEAGSWLDTIHFFQYPFYVIEYSISMLGALQLLEQYRSNPEAAINSFKQGASADYNQSIAAIYAETGVAFDFSEPIVKQMGEFLEEVIKELK